MNWKLWRALLLLLCAMTARAQQITVAAAADLTAPLKELAPTFEKATGAKLNLVFGSSGNLSAQIENGAPYDVFLSADADYPRKLIVNGKAIGQPAEYASGKIVLWVRSDSPLAKNLSLEALRSLHIKRIEIANPQHAPYGRAAAAAFDKLGLTQSLVPKLVLGENIAQAAQFVLSGNADAGVIALSLALASPMKDRGVYVVFPPENYPKLIQTAVLTTAGKDNESAKRFLLFLFDPETQSILKRYGFDVPQMKSELKAH